MEKPEKTIAGDPHILFSSYCGPSNTKYYFGVRSTMEPFSILITYSEYLGG